MYSFARRCIDILFGWVQVPMKWIWNLPSRTESGGLQTAFWLILCLILCVGGVVIDIVIRRSARSGQSSAYENAAPAPSRRESGGQARAKEMPIFEEAPPPIQPRPASDPAPQRSYAPTPAYESQPKPTAVYSASSNASPAQMLFDEPAPSVETPASASQSLRLRRPVSHVAEEPDTAVQGGVQSIHTLEDTEKSTPGRLSRLAQQAKSFINMEESNASPNYTRNAKWSEAFNEPVYPDGSRRRKE